MTRNDAREGDAGFGLVEILVSMMLLGIMLAAFAPLLAGMLQHSARASAQATATQVANQQIERVRGAASGVAGTCAALKHFLTTVPPVSAEDSAGRVYTVTQTPGSAVTCPASGAALIPYEVTVTTSGAYAPGPTTITTQIWTVG